MKALRRSWPHLVVGLFALLFLARHLGAASLTSDESATWFAARIPFRESWSGFGQHDAVFVLYDTIIRVWTSAFGQSEFALRFPSAVSAAVLVWLVYFLGRQLGSPGVGVLAASLTCVSPLLFPLSGQARSYAMAAMWITASVAVLLRAERSGRPRDWAFYCLLITLAGYTHLFALIAIAGHLVISRRRPLLACWAISGVALVPLVLISARQTGQVDWIQASTLSSYSRAALLYFGGHKALLLAAAVVALPFLLERSRLCILLVAWACLPALVLVSISFFSPYYVPRYTVSAVPGLALIIALGAQRWWNWLGSRTRVAWRLGQLSKAGLILLTVLFVLAQGRQDLRSRSTSVEDFRDATASTNPACLALQPRFIRRVVGYYANPRDSAPTLAQSRTCQDGQLMIYFDPPRKTRECLKDGRLVVERTFPAVTVLRAVGADVADCL